MKKKALVTIAAIAVCLIGAWQLIGMHDGNNPARDLQEEEATGGMTVTLQISVADIVRSKAANPQDAKLNEALVCRASALRRNSTAWTASMPTTAIPQSKAFCARKRAATFPNPSTSSANASAVLACFFPALKIRNAKAGF